MRVAIVNCYNDNNRGSAALNLAAIEMVTTVFGDDVEVTLVPLAHDAASGTLLEQFRHTLKRFPRVTVADPVFDPSNRRFEIASAVRHWWRPSGSSLNHDTLDRLASADVVVSRGGVIVHGRTPGVGGTASLATRTMALRAAQRLGIATVVYGAQVGPFNSTGSARLASRLLSSAQLAVVRDLTSLRNASDVAPTARTVLAPDSVLRLGAAGLLQSRARTTRRLGVVVSSASPLERSSALDVATRRIDEVIQAVEPEEVRFFVQVNGRASSDVSVTEAVAERVDRASTVVELCPDYDLGPLDLVSEYSKCSLVVSSRLHATILALLGSTPAISLPTGLTFKERAVLEAMGLKRLASQSDEGLGALAREILGDLDAWRDTVKRQVKSAREQLLQADHEVESAWIKD
jgi:polysaccharide pyruvyl transferase WcaK-like protein